LVISLPDKSFTKLFCARRGISGFLLPEIRSCRVEFRWEGFAEFSSYDKRCWNFQLYAM